MEVGIQREAGVRFGLLEPSLSWSLGFRVLGSGFRVWGFRTPRV